MYAQLEIWRATAAAAASTSATAVEAAAAAASAASAATASTSYSTAQPQQPQQQQQVLQQQEKKPLQKEDSLDISYVLQMLEGPATAAEAAASVAASHAPQPQQQPPPPYPYAQGQQQQDGEPLEESEGKGEKECITNSRFSELENKGGAEPHHPHCECKGQRAIIASSDLFGAASHFGGAGNSIVQRWRRLFFALLIGYCLLEFCDLLGLGL